MNAQQNEPSASEPIAIALNSISVLIENNAPPEEELEISDEV